MTYTGLNGNFDLMKKLNMEKVLRTIMAHRPISRAKISTISGLNKVTVSSCVDFFIDKGIIYELGTTGASRGRPPTLIDLNGDNGIIVGLDVDIYSCRMLVSDLSGKKLEHCTIPLSSKEPELFVRLIADIVSELRGKYDSHPLGIIGFGLALPGHYNYQTGYIEFVANLKAWNGFPIKNEIERLKLNVPFFIETISNAGALGEIQYGKSDPSAHLVYINGFWGLGVGVFSGGDLLTGHTGFAGRLGHSTIHMNGKKCTCGNRGCWEAYASVRALYEQLYPNRPISINSIDEIITGINNNNPAVLSAIHELGYYMAIGLVNVVNAYNPNEICIGGYLGQLGMNLIGRIKNELDEMLPPHFTRNLKVYCSELGELAVAYGCISMVMNNLPHIFMQEA